jgi:hypothetical protein
LGGAFILASLCLAVPFMDSDENPYQALQTWAQPSVSVEQYYDDLASN